MNDPSFAFACDPANKLLRVTMRGFWDGRTVARYDAAAVEAGKAMIAAGGPLSELLVLLDAREMGAQARHAITDYKDRFASPGRAPRRNATLVSSALFRRQVERIAMPNQRIFEDEAEALSWLRS